MKFQRKKATEKVRGILGKYLDGTELEFREATDNIVDLIEIQYKKAEDYKRERDNALIAADKSFY